MKRLPGKSRHAPAVSRRRMPSFDEWRARGGVSGEVRRIIFQWRFPFTIRAVKAAFAAEWPTLTLDPEQIKDCITYMAEMGQITRLPHGRFDPRAPAPKPSAAARRQVVQQIQLALWKGQSR